MTRRTRYSAGYQAMRICPALLLTIGLMMAAAPIYAQENTSRFVHNQKTTGPGTRHFEITHYSSSSAGDSWDDASAKVSSPADACKAVKSRVDYAQQMFKEDKWRAGTDTWGRKQGDCTDFAVAVQDLCQAKDIKTDTYVLRSKTTGKAHAVTMGTWNGSSWVSSNGSYQAVTSLDDAKEKLAREQGWWAPDVEMYKVEKSKTGNDSGYVRMAGDDTVRK
jgi:hypothetical protein